MLDQPDHREATRCDPAGGRGPSSLRAEVVELMLRAEIGGGVDEPDLRAALRRLADRAENPAAALWSAWSGDRDARRLRLSRGAHGRVTIAGA